MVGFCVFLIMLDAISFEMCLCGGHIGELAAVMGYGRWVQGLYGIVTNVSVIEATMLYWAIG